MLGKYKYQLSILATALCFSSLAVFSKLLTDQKVTPFMQVFGRVTIAFLLCSILAFGLFKQKISINKKELIYLIINAVLLTAGYTTLSLSIFFGAPIAKAVALMYAYPLVVVVATYILFKELPTAKQTFSIILSIISIAVLLEIWNVRDLSQINLGEFMALLNAFVYGLIIVFSKKLTMEIKLHPYKMLSYTLLFMMILIFFGSYILQMIGISIFNPIINLLPLNSLLTILGIALIGTTLSLGFLYFGIKRIKPQVAGILLLTEPVWVTLWGFLLFGQTLTFWGILGIIGIITAVLLV